MGYELDEFLPSLVKLDNITFSSKCDGNKP